MNERISRLYTGEALNPDEEIELIKCRIAELKLDISIYEILIEAEVDTIGYFEDRLNILIENKDIKKI